MEAYDVLIQPGILDSVGSVIRALCPAHRYAVIADSQVARLYGERLMRCLQRDGLAGSLITFPAGEWNKTRESWSELTDHLLRARFGRDAAVMALGGGVTGDLAGFVAATFLRGVPIVQIPTTLLAMVDSSVGGKTGVDTTAGKNLVGAFHHPSLVVIDPTLLGTLPAPQLAAGLAEAIKHGLIVDAAYLESVATNLEAVFAREPDVLADIVARSVEIKAQVVAADAREGGYRKILNFGHTVAHAQESISGYGWLHGEAVAAGMVAEAAIGEAIGVTRGGVAAEIRELLQRAGLPVELDDDVDADAFFRVLELDKKREGGQIMYCLLQDIGAVAGDGSSGWTQAVPDGVVRDVLFGRRS